MGLLDRIVNAISGKTTNGVANGNDFLKYGSRNTLMPTWSDVSMDKQDAYKGYAYAAIQKRANKVAKLARENLRTWANDSTTSRASEINLTIMHPYLRAIESSVQFSEKKFWKDISIYLDLTGRYYLGVIRGRIENKETGEVTYGHVKDFVLLNPYEIRRVVDNKGEVAGYVEVKPDGRSREWATHQIIEMGELNPLNQDLNFSMVHAAKESLYTINQATDYARQTLNGNLNSPGIITTDVILEDEDFANFRSRVLNSEKGTPLFGNGTGAINWQSMQINLDQAALTNIKSGSRDEFFAVSGTSKTILGIEESGTTRETARTQTELFLSDVAEPRLEDIIDFLNLDFKEKYPDLYSKYGYLIEVVSSTSRDYDTYIKAVQLKRDEYQLAQDIIDAGYTRETAIKYAKGELELDQVEEIDFDSLMEERQQEQPEPQIPEENPEEQPPTETPEQPTEETTEENSLVETEDGELAFAEPDGWIGGVVKPINITERLTAANKLDALSQTSNDHSSTPAETNPHFTFFYGLESDPIEMKEIIAPIVEKVKEVTVKEISHFELEENNAIVAILEKTPELLKARKLLEKLPHGEQKFNYNPHMTLAYIKKEENPEDFYELFEDLPGQILDVLAVDYGDGWENGLYNEQPTEAEEHNHSHEHSCEFCSHHSETQKVEVYYNGLSDEDSKLVDRAYQTFIKRIRAIQSEAVMKASRKVTVNTFEEEDIFEEEQRIELENKISETIKDYWWILVPILGAYFTGQRNEQFKSNEKFTFNNDFQDKILNSASKVGESHTKMILSSILGAGNKTYKKLLESSAVNLIKELYGRNPEKLKQYFEQTPTDEQIKKAISKTDILEKNKKIYEKANKMVRDGYNRSEIVKAIREEYETLSTKRAKVIADNETARAFTQIQFEADKVFLNATGKIKQAYKELYSRSGSPCEFCKVVINKGPVPFEDPFVELGETLMSTRNGKEISWTADYEQIDGGVLHPGCQCGYRLIIKDSNLEMEATYNSADSQAQNLINKITNKENHNGIS